MKSFYFLSNWNLYSAFFFPIIIIYLLQHISYKAVLTLDHFVMVLLSGMTLLWDKRFHLSVFLATR